MKTNLGTETASDPQLVEWSLTGDREAFGRIVERYQSLVCSITYGATGSLTLSEDIAQETFLTAWRQLTALQDAGKLRAWLCGIARNLVHNSIRRGQREPAQIAEPLDTIRELPASELSPSAQAVSREEEVILWRALERIPETYREPLILFYREQQSVERVARELELSEDAVKQRLSRGRTMLTEQVAAFVEGALQQTTPGKAFTLGVLAVLPVLTTSAKAATIGATAKAASGAGFFASLLGAAPIAAVGGFVGYKMKQDSDSSMQRRRSVAVFWRTVVMGLLGFVFLPLLVFIVVATVLNTFGQAAAVCEFRLHYFGAMSIGLGILYLVVTLAVLFWIWQRRRVFEPTTTELGKSQFVVWVILATIGAGFVLWFVVRDANWKVRWVSEPEAQQLISMNRQTNDLESWIFQYKNGRRELWLAVKENDHLSTVIAPADEATISLLAGMGVACPVRVQGRDFEVFGRLGKLLPVLCIFVLAAGAVMLLKRPKNKTGAF